MTTAKTDTSGSVTVDLIGGQEYVAKVLYTDSSGNAYQYNGSVTAGGATTILLTSTSYYEHIDIKESVAATEGATSFEIGDIVSVVVYSADGTKVYESSGYNYASGTSNWQMLFDGNHSIKFYTSYTVVITYKIKNDATEYVATFTSESTYPSGTYYPYDGSNAYKLYYYLTGINYGSDAAYQAAVKAGTVSETALNIGGMSIYLVASIICDSSSVTGKGTVTGSTINWGLDFALSVDVLKKYGASFDLEILKTYSGGDMAENQFTFYLYGAGYEATSGLWIVESSPLQTVTNAAATADTSTKVSSVTIELDTVAYGTTAAGTYYYILYEKQGDDSNINYDSTVYGIKVEVVYSGTAATVTKTYYTLTETSTSGEYTGTETTVTESDEESVFTFNNTVNDGITLVKVDERGNDLSEAVFTLKNSSDEYYDRSLGIWSAVATGGSKPTISLGSLTITLPDGTYTLTEVSAPSGYNLLSGSITIIVSGGKVTEATYSGTEAITVSDDKLTVTIANTPGYSLPSTGGPGTYLYTLAGLLLIFGAVCLMYKNLRQKKDLPF